MTRGKKIILFALSAITLFIWYAVFTIGAQRKIEVIFFDIGQGDAALIQTNDGKQILIDGGPGKTILSKLGDAMPYWDRAIELVILTHPHADHLDGLIEVLKNYNVEMVLDSGARYHTADYAEWQRLRAEQKIPLTIAKAGQRVHITQFAYLDVLAPLENFTEATPKNIHDAVIVTRLSYQNQNARSPTSNMTSSMVLFAGDMERRLEHDLVSRGFDVNAGILKVGHHGSKTSSSEYFLKAVSPKMAIISLGAKNRYGHPHQIVLDRLEKMGIRIRRTDIEGDIIFHF